jgi:beta-hydroxyacyl-ACP dehydratase FabZ
MPRPLDVDPWAGVARTPEGHPYGFVGPLDVRMIRTLLPHAYPFLLVDRVLEIAPDGSSARTLKNVTANEEFFAGHFPDEPVMPGVLQIEGMAQASGLMLLQHREYAGGRAYLLSLENVKFRRRVVPGDQLIFETQLKVKRERLARVEARATVNGTVVAEAHIGFALAR